MNAQVATTRGALGVGPHISPLAGRHLHFHEQAVDRTKKRPQYSGVVVVVVVAAEMRLAQGHMLIDLVQLPSEAGLLIYRLLWQGT